MLYDVLLDVLLHRSQGCRKMVIALADKVLANTVYCASLRMEQMAVTCPREACSILFLDMCLG